MITKLFDFETKPWIMFPRKSTFVLLFLACIISITSGNEISDVVELDRNLREGDGKPYDLMNCTCDDDCDSHESGDPHFRMWSNAYYDFQSSCDMIHVRNSLLDLHIRTKYRGGFSAVSLLALRFTTDILEMDDTGDLWVNGLAAAAPFTLDGIYPVTSVVTTYGPEVTVTLSGAQSILFTARNIYGINIYIDAHGSDFCDSQGMAGTWLQSGFLQRDGVTPVSPISPGYNKIEYGEEWEVNAPLLGDPLLLSTPATDNCADPPACDPLDPYFDYCNREQRERKLQDLDPFTECSSFVTNPSDIDDCVFDWNVAGEAMARDNPAYIEVWEPTERCVAVDLGEPPPTACEKKGGECKYRCDPNVSSCLVDLCRPNVDLDVLGDPASSDVTYLEGCYCAVPSKSPSLYPSVSPTISSTPLPPTVCLALQLVTPNFPQIAGYFARTDATVFLERDLIQAALEDSTTGIGDESCVSFNANARSIYDGVGAYWSTIPTYRDTESDSYNEFSKYYGKDDWVDIWASKAIKKTRTNYKRGNANFGDAFPSNYAEGSDCVGFEEVLKKGLAYVGQLAELLQLGQKARDEAYNGCQYKRDCCALAIEAWDAAAASYVGSLEGTDGNNDPAGTYGKAPYTLADLRCRNFKNCGPGLDESTKDVTANTNTKILALFSAGSVAAWEGDYNQLDKYIRLISNKAAVPLIQGTLRYYYRLSDEEGVDTFSVLDKEVGEGGAFIFGVLPKLWACSSRGVKKAEQQSKIGGGVAGVSAVNFQDIKLALECNYRCLGITCAEVGALYDGDDSVKPGAEACEDEENGSDNTCAKPSKDTKTKCKLFTGNPGVKGRDKIRFDF